MVRTDPFAVHTPTGAGVVVSEQDVLAASSPFGPLPMDVYQNGQVPPKYQKYIPESFAGVPLCLLVIRPPMAAVMGTVPEEMLKAVILPALEAADTGLGREKQYQIAAKSVEDEYLLWISED